MTNDQKTLNLLNEGQIKVNFQTGEVFSILANNPQCALGAKTKKGYLRTTFYNHGEAFTVMVHRIVWIAAHGIPLPSMRIDHKNRNKIDNKLTNLQLLTNSGNLRRAWKAGVFKHVGWRNASRNEKGQFIGKKAAGRLLDGQEWNERPE